MNKLISVLMLCASAVILTACGGGADSGDVIETHTVSTIQNANGSITPQSLDIDSGNTAEFTITPDLGYQIDTVTGCSGSLSGNTYTTGAVTADCTVSVSFTDDSVMVLPLNDTGITRCANETDNDLNCAQEGFPGQDAEYGRDATHNDDTDGHAGFSFTKLDANGNALPASATEWSCVKDNVTGLIWEVKTDDGGLRDKDNTYTWYNSDSNTNGGNAGTENGGTCPDAGNCDTEKYVASVNAAGLCGYNDWRMPIKEELRSIVNYGAYNPAIETAYFPNTVGSYYWTASPYASYYGYAWIVNFDSGYASYDVNKYNDLYARLVRPDSN